MIRKVDFISTLLENEVIKFVEQNGANAVAKMQTQDFVDGAVVLNIPIKRTGITSLLQECRFPVNKEMFGFGDAEDIDSNYIEEHLKNSNYNSEYNAGNYYSNLFQKITDEIIKIDNPMSFEECLNMAIKFRNKLDSKFYGCMLKSCSNNDIVINPFHILTALSCIENSTSDNIEVLNVLNEKFYLIIYVNQNEEELDYDYKSAYADMALVDKNINCLMQAYSSKINQKIKLEKDSESNNLSKQEIERILNNGSIDIRYRTSEEDDLDDDYNYYLVATQAGTYGVMFPFYGASLIRMDKSFTTSEGTTLTPFNSVNIAGSDDQAPETIIYDSVCTGSDYHKTTIKGLRTLTHSNYSSPYSTSQFLHAGCLVYARRMIEKSLEIYRKSQFINFKEQEDVSIDFIELIEKCKIYNNTKENENSDDDNDFEEPDDDDVNF